MNDNQIESTGAKDAESQKSQVIPENMRAAQASRYTGVSESKLAKLRMPQNRKDGPAYSKVAGCIVYRRADLDEWLAKHVVSAAA